ncbi:outer membrane exchange protein TraB [Hyalangium rubrum]|uniref:Outer membrane exchange protein TraB n=1 Tax=Hyalangium rubrum TaxID=3103134 RepID=A0ABU5HGQ3_9BACT|nr:outer membrane exchange protein TraB [Hyalangium sp. s54d21]MDY7232342.1 outer membrane exchange protein TraB [Hyalangium sp. s54d21]
MKRSLTTALALALGLAATAATAQDARFDVQLFRPSGAPQDVVMVGQSRPLAHMSASGGFFLNFSLDPLVLVNKSGDSSKKVLSLVGNRLQLDAMATVGVFDWAELGVDMPLVLAQGGDNLEAIGSEGAIKGYVLGDLRLTGKVAVPGLRRRPEDSGLGAAITFGLGLPTGDQEAFASDGELTYSPGLLVDYRFESGILLSGTAGLWDRPDRVFNGTTVGDMAPFGIAAEVPILRGSGITAVGMVHGAVGLDKLPDEPRNIPAELLFGLRWYSSTGLTFTVGGGGGCGCSLQAPSLRFFTSIVWVPAKTAEWEAIEKFKEPPEPPPPPPPDSDGDSVTDDLDVCPKEPGRADRGGCPIRDADGDGVEDSLDKCPQVAAGPDGKGGCPLVRIQGNKILILEQVNFATDQDVILSESFPILEEVSQVLKTHPEINRLLVEGHTDARASDDYNLDLSNRRAASVRRYLEESGVSTERLCSQGFGRTKPLAENDTEEGMALNRRVEFTILPPAAEGEPRCPGDPVEKPGKKKGGKRAPASTPLPAPTKPAEKP